MTSTFASALDQTSIPHRKNHVCKERVGASPACESIKNVRGEQENNMGIQANATALTTRSMYTIQVRIVRNENEAP